MSRAVVQIIEAGLMTALTALMLSLVEVAGADAISAAPPGAVTAMPVAARPDGISAAVTARAQASRVEVASLRTETSTTWSNPDGTMTTEAHGAPIQYKDRTGTWRDIDQPQMRPGSLLVHAAASRTRLDVHDGDRCRVRRLPGPSSEKGVCRTDQTLPHRQCLHRKDSIMKRKIAAIAALVGLQAAVFLMTAPAGSATDPGDAPPGYGGPVTTCPGTLNPGDIHTLYNASGGNLGSNIQIWYSSANGGTYCAKTYDNLAGSHHIEVVVRRGDWTTNWYDSGTYTTYAGGIEVFGAATKCVYFFGRVTVNGVNYESRPRTWECP